MKFYAAVFLIAASMNAFAGGRSRPAPVASIQPSPSPSPISSVKPSPKPVIGAHIGFKFVSGTDQERALLALAETKANETVQSKCFEDFMLTWGLIQTDGKTPAQVVAHLRQTRLTVPVHYYYRRNSTVGYRQPPYPDVYFNRRFHTFYDACETSSNATHEWSHVIGYDHPSDRTPTRGRTVPYAINQGFDQCCH